MNTTMWVILGLVCWAVAATIPILVVHGAKKHVQMHPWPDRIERFRK